MERAASWRLVVNMSEDDTPHHLRMIDLYTVNVLCDRALTMCPSPGIRVEIRAFQLSRTPWDATRVANAIFHLAREKTPDVMELVHDLDAAAEAVAGIPLTNKQGR